MKPQVVGSACHRLQAALDEAMAEGVLNLAPELAAHAARCARCAMELKETEGLLGRLRNASAGIDLSRVPHVVDFVMSQTTAEPVSKPTPVASLAEKRRQKGVRLRWVLTQVAAVAAVLLIAVSGLTYTVLKVNEVVSGVKPTEVLAKLVAPFSQTQRAEFHGNAK